MLDYDMPLYRPPSEARSLILQATLGCSHNRCAFCVAYQTKRFKARKEEEVFRDIELAKRDWPGHRRIFLADGDAMALSAHRLIRIAERCREAFPRIERISLYASPMNILAKSMDDLKSIRASGISLVYFGVESGDDEVLRRIDKGATAGQIVEAGRLIREAGFEISSTVILGLAGPEGSRRHAIATAGVLNRIGGEYMAALTLMLEPRTPSFEEVYGAPFRSLTTVEALEECRVLVEHLEADGVEFRSNHASNWLALKGTLQKDKKDLLKLIDAALTDPDSPLIRPDFLRAL